jgi:hypothetical protein
MQKGATTDEVVAPFDVWWVLSDSNTRPTD